MVMVIPPEASLISAGKRPAEIQQGFKEAEIHLAGGARESLISILTVYGIN
jgi:hypothetical protein